MEGKAVLFKIFADIDVFDLEINETDPDKFIEIVKSLEPTFGGINLEDIKAPECFYIEEKLRNSMNIPVMHDDQHGTAIISGAALLNALEIQKKKIEKVRFVVNGAGAAAMACINLYVSLGANPKNFILFDKDGVLHKNRTDITPNKQRFLVDRSDYNLESAIKDADIFIGLSVGNVVTPNMVKSMAKNPIVFAMANPNPEITYQDAIKVRNDIIMATGRSDYPNQVNNVLGFPFIFRGALDVRAKQINESMKLAAVYALADLAKHPVPEIVNIAYNQNSIIFGKEYIIPKPLDPRLIAAIAPAVAKAAIDSGVAQKNILDFEEYKLSLNKRLGLDNQLLRVISNKAKQNPKRLVFAEADNPKILKAAANLYEDGLAFPILLGTPQRINKIAEENNLDISEMPIIDPRSDEMESKRKEYGEILFEKRKRKGLNLYESNKKMRDRIYFGAMMVATGDADAMLSGLTKNYSDSILPALNCIGTDKHVKKIAGLYILLTKKGPLFLADTTVNINPTAEELADIALLVANEVKQFNIKPVVALLSYSNFGSSSNAEVKIISEATKIIKQRDPNLIVDGEMQGGTAFNKDILKDNYPFSPLVDQDVNIIIFPNLSSGNIAFNLLREIGNFEAIGPILLGLKKPVHILQLGSTVRAIINMAMIAVVDAQLKSKNVHNQNSIDQVKWWKKLRKNKKQ